MGVLSWISGLWSRPAEPARLVEAAGVTIDDDDGDWRPLGRDARRDLSPVSQQRMQELAAYLWESNRIANRLIELPMAFLLGEGVTLEVDDPEAQAWLDAFWLDPINRMDLNLEKHVRELALFGEQCWPVFANEITGRVRLGKVDPASIETVITDPENVSTVIGVVVRRGHGRRKVYRVIYPGEDAELFGPGAIALRAKWTDGDCFFWRVNDLSTGRRGRSDLLSAIDFADAYEQLLFGEVERATALRQVAWDVTLKGATPEEVDRRAKEIRPPEPLSTRVHNDSEIWQLLTPQLNSADASEAARLIRNHLLGGATIPEHWLGGAGEVNLATASSMGEPTYKVFSQRQRLWKAILEDIGAYVIRQRMLATGRIVPAGGPAYKVRAVFPELTARDVTKYAAALQQVVMSAAQAVNAAIMAEETAVKIISLVATLLGLEIDPAEELAAARADAARRAEGDVYREPVVPTPVPAGPAPVATGIEPAEDPAPREPV